MSNRRRLARPATPPQIVPYLRSTDAMTLAEPSMRPGYGGMCSNRHEVICRLGKPSLTQPNEQRGSK
jgi:hypothetical protein